jgi:hypothetical protein
MNSHKNPTYRTWAAMHGFTKKAAAVRDKEAEREAMHNALYQEE